MTTPARASRVRVAWCGSGIAEYALAAHSLDFAAHVRAFAAAAAAALAAAPAAELAALLALVVRGFALVARALGCTFRDFALEFCFDVMPLPTCAEITPYAQNLVALVTLCLKGGLLSKRLALRGGFDTQHFHQCVPGIG